MEIVATKVGILRCDSYAQDRLGQVIAQLAETCSPDMNLRSARVLLKPNLISARRNTLACTEGAFLEAVARWYLDHGARVTVGDSPAFGTTRSVLTRIGVLRSLERAGVCIADFQETEPVTLPSGLKTGLAVEAMHADLLVNLPRVKAHAQMRVTLAVKNYFGCVTGLRKPLWHMRYGGRGGGFSRHIVEILSVLPPGITLVDGITAMHGTGPIGGEPFSLGIAACSANPVAADRAMLEIIGLAPASSPVMQACIIAGLTGTAIGELAFPFLTPGEVRVQGFLVPEELQPVRFNPFRFLYSSMKRTILQQRPST
jgi:uncharacterized protein (DUF362 family)